MKARKLKALGFALLGSLALLFAGCGQQGGGGTGGGGTGGGGTGNGAVTNVGIQLPQPPAGAGGYSGVIGVNVTVNEGAQVRRIVLKVDGQQVSQIDVAGLRPQGVVYTILLDTAQLDPDTNQPRFRNGTYTLTVEVTDVNNNTRSASTTATFLNADYVRGIEVSQTDNPKAPVRVGNTMWYGNGDVFVTVDIVNYSGATYSLSGSSSPFTLQASGGRGGSLSSGYTVTLSGGSATPVSEKPALRLAKSANSSATSTLTANVLHSSSTVATITFGLDNTPPTATPAALKVQYRRVLLDYNFGDLSNTVTTGTSQTLFRGSGASDGGVGIITYNVVFKVGASTVATAALPHSPSPGVTVSGLSNFATHDVEITAVEDALGNRTTVSGFTAVKFQPADSSITLSSVDVSDATPNAGTTFNVTYNATGGFGSLTPRVALKLGDKLVDISGPSGVTARLGAQYVLFLVDSAGNFAVADLPVTVSQLATDKTPPAITVSLPSSVSPSSNITVSGTYSDPNPPTSSSSNNIQIFRSNGSLGNFEWYRAGPTNLDALATTVNYSTTISSGAPNYTGSLGVVVATDRFNNLSFATGTVDVRP
jgi:hypothetical protein